ncbi:hypothetical protein ACLMAL_34820 [Nocardia sp. CWNU-33]|uniref:hypothetical protein n=1 Tax=Nocardia sp. CWNU-33 TaxID=3392117 RepID=UPI00398F2192
MNLRATTFGAALASCAITIAAAPATADPDITPTYQAAVVGESVITVLDNATFAPTEDGHSIAIRTTDGQEILTLPLTFLLDGQRRSIQHRITDTARTLILTPDTGPRQIASPMEDQLALNEFAAGMAKTALGTIAGAVLGALVGAVIGLGSCLVVGPACLATAPAAIGAFAGAGGLLGTLIVGGAALADGLWKYVTTLQAPPGESRYAEHGGILDPNGTGAPDATLRLPNGLGNGLSSGSASGSAKR